MKISYLKMKKTHPLLCKLGHAVLQPWNETVWQEVCSAKGNAERAVSGIIFNSVKNVTSSRREERTHEKTTEREKSWHYQRTEPDEGSGCCLFALLSRAS